MDRDLDSAVIYLTAKKIFIIIVSLQLALLGSIGLDKLGLEIPILRQAVGFIYLTLVPGFLILRLLRINDKVNLETLLYSVGLSLSFLMFTGALINFLYPLIGITKPISEIPLLATFTIIVSCLCIVCYLRDKDYSINLSIKTQQIFSPSLLLLILLPFLAVLGAYLLRVYNINTLLLFLLVIISTIPVLVGFDRLPEGEYPLAIWVVSLSLLAHTGLANVSSVRETVMPGIIVAKNVWNPSTYGTHNALLCNTVLHPIFSILLNINNIVWELRITNILIFSFIPLIMYVTFEAIANKKIAFLSSSLFTYMFPFYAALPFCSRTGFALLFLAFLSLLIVDKSIKRVNKSILSIIFAFSLITSHYGTSYMFMFSAMFAFLLLLSKKLLYKDNTAAILASPTFVSLYTALSISWYMYISSSSNLIWLVSFGKHVASSLNELFTPESSNVIYSLTIREWASITVEILKYLYIIVATFIGIGIFVSLYECLIKKKKDFPDEYLAFSLSFFEILAFTLLPVGTQSSMKPFFISSVVVAPFCIFGLKAILNNLSKLSELFNNRFKMNDRYVLTYFSLFLLIFLIFNGGIFSEVIPNDYSPNALINKEHIKEGSNIYAKEYLYRNCYIPIYNVFGWDWIIRNKDETGKIYLDWALSRTVLKVTWATWSFLKAGSPPSTGPLLKDQQPEEGYILLGYHNIADGIVIEQQLTDSFSIRELQLSNKNKIYDNGGSEIYYH